MALTGAFAEPVGQKSDGPRGIVAPRTTRAVVNPALGGQAFGPWAGCLAMAQRKGAAFRTPRVLQGIALRLPRG